MHGAIPFTRFMDLALYCPVYGYYEKEGDTIGRGGDFFTNVSVGTLFGELLARQFAEWLKGSQKSKVQSPKSKVQALREEIGTEEVGEAGQEQLQIVEAGAHRGTLAVDILSWMRENRPTLFECLEYWIIEPSLRRQEWQSKTLAGFSGQVHWASQFKEMRTGEKGGRVGKAIRGIIFCNELLDAMPIRRFGWDASRRVWFEWGVAFERECFVWTRMPLAETAGDLLALKAEMTGLRDVLPDGFTIESCPAAVRWWAEAAECLAAGKILAIDYGFTDEELLRPERRNGTVRAYRGHHLSDDVLADPGQQDLTAHVNFSAIQRAGESAGLRTDALQYQSQFLISLLEKTMVDLSSDRVQQFQTLTHPEHLGRAFRVLVQARDWSLQALA